MTKKRVVSFLLLIIMILLMATGVLAEENTYAVSVKGTKAGLTSFSTSVPLSKEPAYDPMSDVVMNIGPSGWAYPYQYKCTLKVPPETKFVTITLNSTTEGCLFQVYEPSGKLDPDTIIDGYTNKEDIKNVYDTITINLDENGDGQSAVVFPYTPQTSGSTTSYSCYGCVFFRFVVETEAPTYQFDQNLPTEKRYYQLGKTADTLTVNVPVSDGESVAYEWYKGTDAGKIDTLVAEGATYTPDTSATGITYYQVKATVKPKEGDPAEVSSRVMTAVVKDPNLKVSLDNYGYIALTKESDHIFSVKLSSEVNVFVPKITGKLPDGITIKAVWSGSPVDRFDLTKSGVLTTNSDLNTFTLDLAAAVSDPAVTNIAFVRDPGYRHVYGRCLYIQTSDDEIYTIVADSSSLSSTGFRSNLPELVQLTDLDGTVLPDFQVSELQSSTTKSSVVRGVSSSTALRAQVKNGGIDATQYRVSQDASQYWSEAHQNWIVVNGKPVGGNFYGISEGFSGNSPAFTLQPGLNVVEVYTNFQPFMLNNYRLMENHGLNGTIVREDTANNKYTYDTIQTGSVVYLIDYQGETAAAPAEDTSNTELGNVIALRYGEETDYIRTCPVSWSEDEKAYVLTVPESFNANGPTSPTDYFTHSVLMLAKPAGAGATVNFTSNVTDLIHGNVVANCAFLNIEKLNGQTNPSFTITVTAADGTTKPYPVKVIYVSSDTKPVITVNGPTLDVPYSDDTYAYYLNYASASSASGTMTVSVPEGATATVNGTAFTAPVTLDPKEDFYRVTITAADGLNTSSYYFVTKYADGTMPYTTLSEESKTLAKEMLGGWYDALKGTKYFASYWNVFMAKATGNADGSEYDFNGAYVENPATHGMKQATDWAACIMEIVMLGYNPYSFPYGNNPEFNYVQAMIDCGGGPYANNVWYHMATTATGAPQSMLRSILPNAVSPTYDLDTRAWIIASLSTGYETKDMLYYVDSLHNVQDTSGTYTSLWKNQSWHGATSGNAYTTGCVLSAIASSGADPDRMFAIGDQTPLKTIRDTMYKDGLFNGVVPKDMVIGLGDILHGSNVWARYALTEQKYNDLIKKADELGVKPSDMPTYKAEDTAVGKAYYDLYDAVYAALMKADRKDEAYAMRPDVTWGMPYELFTDAVNAMQEPLTADNLADLDKLIEQYEAMDEGNLAGVEKATLDKYQRLLKQGLALKADESTDIDKIEQLYEEINALPKASEITDANQADTLTKIAQLEYRLGQLSEKERELFDWMGGGSLTAKMDEIKNVQPKKGITVYFTLVGDKVHEYKNDNDIHSYFFDSETMDTWIPRTAVEIPEGATVGTVFQKIVLNEYGFTCEGFGNNYISSITNTKAGITLAEFGNGSTNSGWMYLLNGEHPNFGLDQQTLKQGDEIVWHWTDEYMLESDASSLQGDDGSTHDNTGRIVQYVANLYDCATESKANAAFNKLDAEKQALVTELRANRKAVLDAANIIQSMDWKVKAEEANTSNDVKNWVEKQLNAANLGVKEVSFKRVHSFVAANGSTNGKFRIEYELQTGKSKDGIDLRATETVYINGVIWAETTNADTRVWNVTVCNVRATAEDDNTYTVTVPYGSTVNADSFEITLSNEGAKHTEPVNENGVWKFTVTAVNGTTKDYTVKVTIAPKPADPSEPSKPTVKIDSPNKPKTDTVAVDASKFNDVSRSDWYYNSVQYALENGLMNGTSDRTFSPNADTTRGMIVTILARLDGVNTSGNPWYAAGRTWAMNAGVSDGTNMEGKITREQLAAMLYRYAKAKGYDVSKSADISAYADASSVSSWAIDAMRWAVGAGLINGRTATTLAPQGNATRAEVAAILMRFAQNIAK